MPLKPRLRASQTRYLPLLLLLPFVLGVLSPHWSPSLPHIPHLSSRHIRAADTSSSTASTSAHFLPFHLQKTCQPRLLFDTPSSAGLNALHGALSRLLPGQSVSLCRAPAGCAALLAGVCNGTAPAPVAVVGYLRADADTVECLRQRRGYYAAVAVREPLDRWSAEYVRAGKVSQYLEWMAGYPDCSLLDYFDGRGRVCADDDDVLSRVEEVVERFDEGVDVYAGRGGSLYGKVRRLVGDGVRRDRPSKKFRAFLGMNRLIGETRLYEAVVGIKPREGRVFC